MVAKRSSQIIQKRYLGRLRHFFFFFFLIWQDCFFMLFRSAGSPIKQRSQALGGFRSEKVRFWMPFEIQRGSLYWQVLADYACQRPVSADFGARWILKGSQNQAFSHTIYIKSSKRCPGRCLEKHDFWMHF